MFFETLLNKWQGHALGSAPQSQKSKMAAIISWDSWFQLCSSSNSWDINWSFGSIICHQGGSGATFKYPFMSGISIPLFGPINPFIIIVMGYWSRIKKIYTRITDREQTENRPRIEKPIREATLIDNEAPGWVGQQLVLECSRMPI